MSKDQAPAEVPSPWAVGPLGGEVAAEPESVPVAGAAPVPPGFAVALPPELHSTLLPRVQYAPPGAGPWTWVSAHGGGGATTLARATGIGVDLTGHWPEPALGWPTQVVLVCRGNAAGIDAASRFLAEAASGRVPDLYVAALVVSADAPGRPTKTTRQRVSELSGAVPKIFQLDWISSWRDQPYTHNRAAMKVATALTNLETK